MKHTLTIIIILLLSLTAAAQGNITTFMGIPVDGTKDAMTQQLLKNGVKHKGNDLVASNIEGKTYLIRLETHKGKVYRVSMVETKGTEDVNRILARYEALIEEYRENTSMYCEYEYNPPVNYKHANDFEKYIHDGCYYAEFFQAADPQLYSRRMAFRITDEFGDYRIEWLYDNIFNMPTEK